MSSNKVNIDINFCVNLGDGSGDCGDAGDGGDDTDGDGIDIDINGDDVDGDDSGDDGTGGNDGDDSMGGDDGGDVGADCTDIVEEYQMCIDTATANAMMTETDLNNDATVEMLFALETNIFMTIDEFKEDLLEDMKWDIEEGKTSFTPVTIDDIPECEVTTATPQGCEAEV